MKKILLILMAVFAFGIQNVSAQDAPLKIVTGHPDFKIQIKRCAASGNTVLIDIVFNNIGISDIEEMNVYGGSWGSEAFDDDGNIYQSRALKVKAANKPSFDSEETGWFSLPTGVPVRLTINIEGVPQSVESISRLKLRLYCQSWGINYEKPVLISNIPITRD